MNREPFWWPMNEPPLPYGTLTPAQASYFEELEKEVPEDAAFRGIIDRTKHETRIRNEREIPKDVQFDPAVDLQVDPGVTEHAAVSERVRRIFHGIYHDDADLLGRLADD